MPSSSSSNLGTVVMGRLNSRWRAMSSMTTVSASAACTRTCTRPLLVELEMTRPQYVVPCLDKYRSRTGRPPRGGWSRMSGRSKTGCGIPWSNNPVAQPTSGCVVGEEHPGFGERVVVMVSTGWKKVGLVPSEVTFCRSSSSSWSDSTTCTRVRVRVRYRTIFGFPRVRLNGSSCDLVRPSARTRLDLDEIMLD